MIYIIILVWNGLKYLPKLFASLENLNYPREKYQILAVDSASTDGSAEFLEKLEQKNQIKLIKLQKNLGFCGGNNVAMEMALQQGAEQIVLLNQDTFVEPDFLLALKKATETYPSAGVVQPLILHYQEPHKIQTWGNDLHYLGYGWSGGNGVELKNGGEEIREGKKIPYASGAAVLYQAEMLKKIGLFDENYFAYHEDSDLSLRAKLAGYEVVLAPQAVVYHDYDFPTEKNKIRYFWNEKNRLYLILKFYHFKTLLLILPMMIFMDLGQIVFAIKKGYFLEWLKVRGWFILYGRQWWRARKKVQENRKIDDKKLTSDFASEIKYQAVSNLLLDKIGNPIMRVYWKIVRKII